MKVPWFIKFSIALFRRNLQRIEGLENLPKDNGYIIMPNHQSFLDPIFIWVGITPHINKIIFSLSKEQLKKTYGGFGRKYFGMIYIDNKDKAKCLELALEYLKKGEVICIFPEGKRNYNPINLLKGKTGAIRLAIKAKIPIIPIGMYSPFGRKISEAIKNAFFPKTKAWIRIGKPLYFDKYYKKEPTKEILDNLTRQVMQEIGKLCHKIYPY